MRVRFGKVPVDVITFEDAVAAMAELRHGTVFTPNVDHVVLAENNERLAAAYRRSTLSLADGVPLVVLSRLAGTPLPCKVSGSDLLPTLVPEWGRRGRKAFLVGPGHEVVSRAYPRLARHGLQVVGTRTNQFPTEPDEGTVRFLAKQIDHSGADVVIWSLGAPKQELWADAARQFARRALHVCLGASLEFYVGAAKRAPKWVSSAGLEWAHRLAQNPKRLGPRYLRDMVHFPRVALGSLLRRTG
jgi:N-acetylglucosaminyldiphosphoundecaprenol N-acetyl-beta-D-mannosaminyltransferase